MSRIIRMAEVTPTMDAKIRAHIREVAEVYPTTGEVLPPGITRLVNPDQATHRLLVPSHESVPGHLWAVVVSWHPTFVRAWHTAQLDSAGQPLNCMAYATEADCWHLYAATLWVARAYHDGQVPEPRPRGARPPRTSRPPAPSPAAGPFVPWPPRRPDPGFY